MRRSLFTSKIEKTDSGWNATLIMQPPYFSIFFLKFISLGQKSLLQLVLTKPERDNQLIFDKS